MFICFSPAEFQFYSCFASTILQLPVCLLFMDYKLAGETTLLSFIWMVLNGIAYHIQTMTAWVLMEYLSPVTHRYHADLFAVHVYISFFC